MGDTLEGIQEFEQFGSQYGVKVKKWQCDNMPFNAEVFKKHAKLNNQEITNSGVGAHHQNGVAERGIGMVTCWARAMLLQACLDWPEAGKLEL